MSTGKCKPQAATAQGQEKHMIACTIRAPKFKKVCLIEHGSHVQELKLRRDYGDITSIPARNIFTIQAAA